MDKAPDVVQIPTHQIPLGDLYLASEAPKGSDLVVRDSGRGSPLTDAELKASIEHRGIMFPLIYKSIGNKLYVIAGNRRLRMLRELYPDGPGKFVPAQDVADFGCDWREVALDTNLSLPPHIVERYEQLVMLSHDLKLSPEDACLRFGLTTRQYNQVMALGKMAPIIRQKWRHGEIDAKTAQMFTLEPDQKEQVRIYNLLEKQNGQVYEHVLRMKIVPDNQREAGKMVAFLGVQFCREQKLIKQEDFFQDSHIVSDVKKLTKIATEHLENKCAVLREKGWSWATLESQIGNDKWNYQTLEPKGKQPTKAELEQLDALKQELRVADEPGQRDYDDVESDIARLREEIASRSYTDEQKAKTGCIVSLDNKGSLLIEYGRMKPSDRKAIERSERPKEKAKTSAPGNADEPALNNSLAQRLSEGLELAIAAAMEAAPHTAVAALIASAGSNGELLSVKIKNPEYRDEKVRQKDFVQLFEGALSASTNHQVVMLTKVAMQALDIVTHSANRAPLDNKLLQLLIDNLPGNAVNKHVADHFNAEDYFKGVPLATIVAATRSALGQETSDRVAKMKKSDAVKLAVEQLPKKGWLPPELRTSHYRGPADVKAAPTARAKAEKPKVAKKAAPKKVAKKGKK